jgi:hypothetical protein
MNLQPAPAIILNETQLSAADSLVGRRTNAEGTSGRDDFEQEKMQ